MSSRLALSSLAVVALLAMTIAPAHARGPGPSRKAAASKTATTKAGGAATKLPTSEQVATLLSRKDTAALGSVSLGRPTKGALLNPVAMPKDDAWKLVNDKRGFATQETIDYLVRAIRTVRAQYPDSHPLDIGHLSYENGGPMRPHRSHQSGRDVDLGYYYIASRYIGWYQPANSYSLDCERSWAFIKALVTQTDVEYIFMDARVQRLLKHYAMDAGEDKGWLDTIFQSGSPHPSPIIRHANGHRTHMHVRFHNPRAQQVGFLAHHSLMKKRVLKGRLLRVAPSPEPIVPERRLPTKPDASSGRAVVAHTQE